MSGKVIWLTGISGAGKTTLGMRVVAALEQTGRRVEFIDGNIVRTFFEDDLGFSRADRILSIKRILFASHVLAKHDVHVVVANIAPYYEIRDLIRKKLGPAYIQIYLKVGLDAVRARDVHGHYKKHAAGEMSNLVGVDDTYDIPRNPHLVLETDKESIEESARKILQLLKEHGIKDG